MAKDTKKETKTVKIKSKPTTGRKKTTSAVVGQSGKVYITSTFNNTLVTVTNEKGQTLSWSSSGAKGFKGARKSTPYAASLAVEDACKKALAKGLKAVEVFVKGPGSGRESALRAVKAAGLSISMIADLTPIPHNGPRASKKRRV